MDGFENLNISASNIFWGLLALILFGFFSFFIYKHTIPQVSGRLRISLTVIRTIILALIFFLLLEPVVSFNFRQQIEPETLVFVDNSNSIAERDSAARQNQIVSFLKGINSDGHIKARFYSFGRSVDSLPGNRTENIRLSEGRTNFSNITDFLRNYKGPVNSVVILSDGIINDGTDPTYDAEKLHIPIFTVGIGDSTERKNLRIYDILFNQFVYSGKPTTIETNILNSGFPNYNTRVSLYEENKLIDSKEIKLNESGFNQLNFTYNPAGGGEKKLSVSIQPLPGESTNADNDKTFYINVLSTKLKVGLIAGSPSADVSAVAEALERSKDIQVKKLVQTSLDRFWNNQNLNSIDSSAILFLIDFPALNTPKSILDKIVNEIGSKGKPFFFLYSGVVNNAQLSSMTKLLPFSTGPIKNERIQVEPAIDRAAFTSYFSTDNNQEKIWNNLPPVFQPSGQLSAKPGSTVLIKSTVRGIPTGNPLIVARNLGNQRSFSILAGDIWRWKLQTAESYPRFFYDLIDDIIKWLSVGSNKKQFSIMTDKKTYLPGEQVNFRAEFYDQRFLPVDSAKIEVQIFNKEKKYNLAFAPGNNGIYTAGFTPSTSGDFNYQGTAQLGQVKLNSDPGRFSFGTGQIERMETMMRSIFLKQLANSSNGQYYWIDNTIPLKKRLEEITLNSAKIKRVKNECRIWSNQWAMIIVVILFCVEWLIRKRTGML